MDEHHLRRYLSTALIIVLSFLIISSSALITESSDISADEVPTWVEGDNWSYNETRMGDTITYTAEVVSEKEHIDIDETIFDCYMVNYSFGETHFYSIDSLSLVAEITDDGTFAYNPIQRRFDFPLELEKTYTTVYQEWKKPEDGGTWEEVGGNIEVEFNVEGIYSVDVPAGNFDTILINITQHEGIDAYYEHYYYSPEVKNMVKREEYFIYRPDPLAREELTDYELMEREEKDEDNGQLIPYLNTGVVLLIIATSAVVYSLNYKIKGKDH